jgi:1-acyl-sn-glycerol-3-phosphate acyltransferase
MACPRLPDRLMAETGDGEAGNRSGSGRSGNLCMHTPDPMPPPLSLALRSYMFVAALFLAGAVFAAIMPFAFVSQRTVRAHFFAFLRVALWLLRTICGLSYEVSGRENLPAGPVLFAAKHQSWWDSAVLPMLLGDPATLVKRECMFMPFVGWVAMGMRHPFVRRIDGASAFMDAVRKTRQQMARGRSILIFPEGTRRLARPYAPPMYQNGVAALYQSLRLPCVPVALNSGLFVSLNGLAIHSGIIRIEILPAIEAGMDRRLFKDVLIERIETASRRLCGVDPEPQAALAQHSAGTTT